MAVFVRPKGQGTGLRFAHKTRLHKGVRLFAVYVLSATATSAPAQVYLTTDPPLDRAVWSPGFCGTAMKQKANSGQPSDFLVIELDPWTVCPVHNFDKSLVVAWSVCGVRYGVILSANLVALFCIA